MRESPTVVLRGRTVNLYLRPAALRPGTNTGAPGSPAHTSKITKWLGSPEKNASLVTIMRLPSNCTLEGSSKGTGDPLLPDMSVGKRASSVPVGEITTSWLTFGPTSAMYTFPDRASAKPSGPSVGPLSHSFVRVPGRPFGRIGNL